ncbi:hypothetical protein M7I_0598 [Glarea lozoyensis 74030]|uniref:Transmembrane protein n=1 Tax=Glarea lozoyensis (strain ATCC 74030 / MF5533) TaxID=1104152 RepID=H0EDY7_GLAL7|nr:hypothetical protein M7I_0598 [Glarea lozoyensis 74030]
MFHVAKSLFRLLLTLTITIHVVAYVVPKEVQPSTEVVSSVDATEEEFPEVIPGPGMPRLASLNLTSADLYRGTIPSFGPPSPDFA